MRIAYVITGLGKGGAETQLSRLAIAMAKTDDIHVFSLTVGGPIEKVLRDAGVPVTVLSANPFTVLFRLRRAIKAFKPDIIHSYLWHSNIIARLVAASLRVPTISALRLREQGWHKAVSERITRGLVDAYTSNSDAVPRSMGITEYVFTPNGVPDDFWSSKWQRKPEKRHAVMVAHLRREKDHETLLLVAKRLPEWTFSLAGTGDREEYLKARAKELGLANVRFLGFINDARPLLEKATCLLHLSFTEGMPNAIVEAMLAGVPVIASDIPENREVVGDRGKLVPLQDPDAVVAAMGRVPWPTTEAQAWAKKRFSMQTMIASNRELYDRVLKARR